MATVDEGDWELVNDDGFVYKRKRRTGLDPTISSAPPPPLDSAADENNRRERKKKSLVKLKEKYRNEITQWKHLSNILNDMQRKSQTLQQAREHHVLPPPSLSDRLSSSPDPNCGRLLNELLSQVQLCTAMCTIEKFQAEAQEAILEDVWKLCDVAETLLKAHEENLEQSLADLPIWASSPDELITSLCQD